MGRGFSGIAFARQVFGLALAASLWAAGPAGAQQTGLGNGGAALGNGQKAAPATPEVKSPAPDAAKEPAPPAAEKAPADSPKAAEPKAGAAKTPANAAAAPEAQAAAPAAAAAAAAPADQAGGSSSPALTPSIPTFGADGALRYSYALDLPAFHGLEPDISFNYDSGRKTKLGAGYQGWLGFGWGLDGFEMIERQRPKGGVPAFDDNDVMLLDGAELVGCAPGLASPSCLAGGTHVTETESYQRISHDAAAHTWTVTDRGGTQTFFKPVGDLAANPGPSDTLAYFYRWMAQKITDVHGNQVVYIYDCPQAPVCYPQTINYGPYQVSFYLEDRPDHILMANGESISDTGKRIKAVRILSNGAMVSAYALAYSQAPASNNSRLASITRYGTDAVVDTAGNVTAGTSLTPVVFSYRDFNTAGAGYDTAYSSWDTSVASPCTDAAAANGNELMFLDINNDGTDELTQFRPGPCNRLLVNKFDFSGAAGSVTQTSTGNVYGDKLPGNFLGVQNSKAIINSSLSQTDSWGGTGNPASTSCGTVNSSITFDAGLNPSVAACTANVGPFGEDCANLFQYGQYSSYTGGQPPGCTGNYHSVVVTSSSGESKISHPISTDALVGNADYAGNGAAAPLVHAWNGVYYQYTAATSPVIGGGYITGPVETPAGSQLADINGDGLTDLIVRYYASLYIYPSRYIMWFKVYLATGNGFAPLATNDGAAKFSFWADGDANGAFESRSGFQTIDLDGDGKSELLYQTSAASAAPVLAQYKPLGFTFQGALTGLAHFGDFAPTLPIYGSADINGDSLPDFPLAITGGNYVKFLLSNGADGLPNSMLSIKNELGGTHSFKFKPSTRYVNQYLPFAMSTVAEISADDGRGGVAVQKIAYAGGKYNPDLRRFMGFETVTETRPCAPGETGCATIETTYLQEPHNAGLVSKTVARDGGGAARRTVAETWSIRRSVMPYLAENTWTSTTLTDTGSGALAVTMETERLYDVYGNVTDLKEHGRIDLAGDEVRTLSPVTPNLTAFIVDRPYFVETRGGNAVDSPVLKRSQFYYDNRAVTLAPLLGDLTRQVDFQSLTPLKYASMDYSYDAAGNRRTATDALGAVTAWIYDAASLFLTAERDALFSANPLHQTVYVPDTKCGQPSEKTGPDGVRFTYLYDPFCRPYDERNTVTGSYHLTRYAAFGQPQTQYVAEYTVSPGGSKNNVAWLDGFGRTWRERLPGEVYVDVATYRYILTSYDARGNVVSKSLPHFTGDLAPKFVTTSYDWADRPLVTTLPDGATRSKAYKLLLGSGGQPDPGLFYESGKDELNRDSAVWISSRGRPVAVYRKIGGVFQTEYRRYDLIGRMTGVSDHAGAVWTNVFDLVGNRVSAADPDLGTWTYAYDSANQLISQTDARGKVTGMTYDKLGRLLTRRITLPAVPDPLLTDNIYDEARAGYYNVGRLTTSRNSAVTQTFDYSAGGAAQRQVSTDAAGAHSVTASLYFDSPVYKVYSPGALSVGTSASHWTYDGAGRLKSIPGIITSQTYEADGQTKAITYANGVTTAFLYSPARRWLMRVTTKNAANVALMDNIYTRDAAGRIKRIDGLSLPESWIYLYDDLDRLISADNLGDNSLDEGFSYDLADNMLSRTRMGAYVYPAGTAARPHTPLTVAGRAFAYDGNGNLTSDGLKSLAWTNDNRLASVVKGGQTASFAYGPDGARAKKVSSLGTTRYFGAEAEEKGGVFTRYPHMDVMVQGTAISFLHRDHLNSVKMVTNMAGAVTERTGYAAFGEPKPSTSLPKGFIGERPDPETGMQYLNARYYDPALGRFVSPDDWDPTLAGVGTNRYAYAGNDPVNKADANGHFALGDDAIAMGIGAIGGAVAQLGVDAWNGELSDGTTYLASIIGGAAAGEATLYTGVGGYAAGATARGAIIGIQAGAIGGATGYAAEELLNGNIPTASGAIRSAAYGGMFGGVLGAGGARIADSLSPRLKGKLGEALTGAYLRLRGESPKTNKVGIEILGSGGKKTIPDFTLGGGRYAEAKFGYRSRPTKNQSFFMKSGGNMQVHKFTPDSIARGGSSGSGSGRNSSGGGNGGGGGLWASIKSFFGF
jgi:RHS repeat-associated protein